VLLRTHPPSAADPASLLRWGVVAFVPRHSFERPPVQYNSLGTWLLDFIRRCHDLGMDMGCNPQGSSVVGLCRVSYGCRATVNRSGQPSCSMGPVSASANLP
jgi:hypothetical protein